MTITGVGHNVTILEACNNTASRITIDVNAAQGNNFAWYIGRNSNGEIIGWNPADHVIPQMTWS